jgi:hypothetical protein
MGNEVRDKLVSMAVKSVWNAMTDHYLGRKTHLTKEEYWQRHLSLTGFQSVDSYLQDQVNACFDAGIGTASEVATAVKKQIGLS